MARGYPDFFGYPVVPNYGVTTKKVQAIKVILAGETYDLLDFDIKGRILGGRLFLNPASVTASQYTDITIDGVVVHQLCANCEDCYKEGLARKVVVFPIRIDHNIYEYEYQFILDVVINYNILITMHNEELVDVYGGKLDFYYNGYEAET